MSRLVEVFGGLGYEGAWTHINSGNVVFEATGGRAALERTIEGALESTFGFEVTTFVRTATELDKAVHVDPFTLADGDTYFITFLKEVPPPPRPRPWRRPRTASTPSSWTVERSTGG